MNMVTAAGLLRSGTAPDRRAGVLTYPLGNGLTPGIARAGLSTTGELLLLLKVDQNVLKADLPGTSGLELSLVTQMVDGARTRFLTVCCTSDDLEGVFHKMGDAVCERLEEGGNPVAVLTEVISDFRKLLSKRGKSLTDEELAGLIGELEMLRIVAEAGSHTLPIWTGPDRTRHDFCGRGLDVEVKASWNPHPERIRIHGQHQLEAAEGKDLLLAVIGLEKTGTGGHTLKDFIGEVVGAGIPEDDFLDVLGELGVDDLEEFEDRHFEVGQFRYFRVREGFPRIVPSSFVAGALPQGVHHLDFDVDLTVAQAFEVESSQARNEIRQMARKDA